MKKALHWSAFCFGYQLSLCLLSEASRTLWLYVCYAAIADKSELPPDDRIPAHCGPSYLSNSFSPHRPGAEGLFRKRLSLRLYVWIHIGLLIGLLIGPSEANTQRLYCTLTGAVFPALRWRGSMNSAPS